MRLARGVVLAGVFAISAAASASAAPLAPSLATKQASNILQVAGGCGRGWHPNRWGRCVPNRYYGYRPYWYGHYYRWHAPNDFVANDLNRHQLYRPWGY